MSLTFVNQIGAVEGMNQAAPGTLIPESFVRWSQDVLFDRAGLMRRRGPFENLRVYQRDINSGAVNVFQPTPEDFDVAYDNDTHSEFVVDVVSTYDPNGETRFATISNVYNESTYVATFMRFYDAEFVAKGWKELVKVDNYPISSAVPALGGGLWLSFANDPSDPDRQVQYLWRGGCGCGLTGDTIKTGVDITVDGVIENVDFSTGAVTPGQFAFIDVSSDYYYLGVVKSINTVTNEVTLEKRPFYWDDSVSEGRFPEAGATVRFSGLRPYIQAHGRGIINVSLNSGDITSGTAGSSAEGHWKARGIDNSWLVYRASDNAFIGRVVSVTDNTSLKINTYSIINKALTSNVATLTTDASHNFNTGDTVTVTGVDATFNGSYTITSTPSATTFSYAKISGNVSSTNVNPPGSVVMYSKYELRADEYIMRPVVPIDLSDPPATTNDAIIRNRSAGEFGGLYTAVYAGYQWFGNFAKNDEDVNRVVFSAAHDPEAVDLSADSADSIVFPGKSQFRGMASSSSGLLVFLEDRTYILRGNDRTNFSVEQLVPDGCLCASSIVEYGGGVFWASKRGIMFFDGASVRNLTRNNLGLYYSDSLESFDPINDRVYGFIHKDNLIMYFSSWTSEFKAVRYEPFYAEDWNTTPALIDRDWTEFDPDYDYDDFFTNNNTPIYWDQLTLNDAGSSGNLGRQGHWFSLSVGNTDLVLDASASIGDNTLSIQTSPTSTRLKLVATAWDPVNNIPDPLLSHLSYSEVVRITDITGSSSPYTIDISPNLLNDYDLSDSYYNIEVFEADVDTYTDSFGNTITYPTDFVWDTSSIYKWGPLRKNAGITFSIYLPTNALTTLSNMEFLGHATTETDYGLISLLGVHSIENVGTTNSPNYRIRNRIININPVFDLNVSGEDPLLISRLNIPQSDLFKGPDFYLQTKHFTVGDPILRKWFQRLLLNMLLYDGALRVDFVDDDDNDAVDINKKKPRNWVIFTEKGYTWDYLGKGEANEFGVIFPKLTSPNKSTWENVEGTVTEWLDLYTSDFNRYSKRMSWRKGSIGFRLYQMNNYRKPFENTVTRPNRLEVQGFSIGFKPLRQGRI